ncbi:hypothetical protein FS837_011183 [Tulasnella sp. UAMH 9824]|nr:hypothetical protein FS837_011183 [Tulasnella sp. UAMH 9824]
MTKNKKKSFKNRKRTDDNEVVINKDGWTNRPSMPEREGEWTTDWANAKFETYYKHFQKILPEEEWDTFMEYMRKTLPTTFRLPAGKLTTPTIVDIIATVHIPHLSGIEFEGEKVDPPRSLPWYPRGLGYEFSAPKRVLRKLPEMKEFHQFLVYQTEVGNVSRQEAVSMVPPLLLDVQPHHVVLDACASPGSKTAQLVEALHTRIDSVTGDASFVPFPNGIVIANDSEYTRAQLLVHQSARLPTPSLMVTNLDASLFPTLRVATGVLAKEAEGLAEEGDSSSHRDFDSYEAYCQATGGGEMKFGRPKFHKSMWPPENASELGLENCLRIYPHLQNTGGFFVALIHKLPGSPPEATSIPDPTAAPVDFLDDSVPDRDDSALQSPKKRAASPPSHLPLPKKAKVSKNSNSKLKATSDKSGMVIGSIGTNPGGGVFKEAPFTFIRETDPLLQESSKRLHLKSSFPSANVFVRHPPTDYMKTFYFCNSLVKSVILHNPLERIRLVSAGVKAFSRQDMGPAKSLSVPPSPDDNILVEENGAAKEAASINYPKDRQVTLRFTNEGILTVVDFVDDGVKVHADLETLKSLLLVQFPLLDQLLSGSFAESIRPKPTGSYIVVVEPEQTEDGM